MTATGHAVIGALIAAKFQNPVAALTLSFVSHFAADAIPHWDCATHRREKTKKQLFIEATIDVGIGMVAAFLVYHVFLGERNYFHLYLCVIASQLPDWLAAPYLILHLKSPIIMWSKSVYKVQHLVNSRLDQPWGVVTQVVTVIGLYVLLFKLF